MNQRVVFISVVSILLLLIDLYVFQAVQLSTQDLAAGLQFGISVGFWTISVITILTLALAIITRGAPITPLKAKLANILFIIVASKLVVVILLLVSDLYRLLLAGLRVVAPDNAFDSSQSLFFSKHALMAGGFTLATFLYGMVRGAYAYQVKKISLKFPNLPAGFNGYKMVQISDLHTGSFNSGKPLEKAVSIINQQNADVVFFTGDLVNNTADEVQPYIPVLSRIKSKAGVYSVLGNHDYADYVTWPSREAKQKNFAWLMESHKTMGWRLLMNEHTALEKNGDKIALLGIENWGGRAGFPKYGRLDKAYAGTEKYPVKILLSHDPSHWEAEVRIKYQDIDLMLSGHTHGLQFGINLPFFKWSPVQYVYKEWAGLYKRGRQYLYVNTGLGFIGFHGRVGFLPEITVIELQQG